jgi:conjugative transfer region protein (TIGR03750 family)
MDEITKNTANLIDNEPVLVLGCNNNEIQKLALAGLIVGAIIGLLLSVIFWSFFILLPFLFVGPMLSIYFGGQYLGKKKEGKPDGYFNRQIIFNLNRLGFGNTYITHTGFWRNSRELSE